MGHRTAAVSDWCQEREGEREGVCILPRQLIGITSLLATHRRVRVQRGAPTSSASSRPALVPCHQKEAPCSEEEITAGKDMCFTSHHVFTTRLPSAQICVHPSQRGSSQSLCFLVDPLLVLLQNTAGTPAATRAAAAQGTGHSTQGGTRAAGA